MPISKDEKEYTLTVTGKFKCDRLRDELTVKQMIENKVYSSMLEIENRGIRCVRIEVEVKYK